MNILNYYHPLNVRTGQENDADVQLLLSMILAHFPESNSPVSADWRSNTGCFLVVNKHKRTVARIKTEKIIDRNVRNNVFRNIAKNIEIFSLVFEKEKKGRSTLSAFCYSTCNFYSLNKLIEIYSLVLFSTTIESLFCKT